MAYVAHMQPRNLFIASILLAIGIALAGWFVGNGLITSRVTDRFVTVKGVSEREVQADLALWPLKLNVSGNDLSTVQSDIDRQVADVVRFLVRHRVDTSGVSVEGLEVTDRLANPYGESGPIQNRYVVQQTLIIRSEDPEAIQAASQEMGELVDAGVVFTSGSGYGPAQPTFIFTLLNKVKPAMIAEATANAREAAEQFASDSNSTVGGIRRANQGVFVILARDQAPGIMESAQIMKTVRVVSTVEYYLH